MLVVRSIDSLFFLLAGALLLCFALKTAIQKRKQPLDALMALILADTAFMVIGFGSGGVDGSAGAILQFVYTGIARLTAYLCLNKLISYAKDGSLHSLTGIGRARPITTGIFAFSMFAAIGISPLFTPDAKIFILHSLFATGQTVVPILLVCANICIAVVTVTIVHNLWLKKGSFSPASERPLNAGALTVGLAALLGLMGIFAHPLAHGAAAFAGFDLFPITGFTLNWPLAALIPFVGAFALVCITRIPVRRNTFACIVMLFAFATALFDTESSPLGHLFSIVAMGIGFLATLYSRAYIHESEVMSKNAYYFFLLILFGSLGGLAGADNLGGFFVFWELMTFSSYVLVAYEGTDDAHRAAIKYFVMCTVGAAIMLPGLLLIGAKLGTLDIAALSNLAPELPASSMTLIALLALVGFGVKAGLVPGHSWLPDAHPAAPSSISGPLSGVLTKTGIFGITQVFLVILGLGMTGSTGSIPFAGKIVTFLGVLTLLYGELMALRQTDIKRLLAFSTMGQVGEITMTLGLCTYLATAGALLHFVNHAIMKDLLFFATGVLLLRSGSRELADLKGLGRAMPFTATCMVIGLISILGLPPFTGFMSKYLMVYALASTAPSLAALLLLASMAGVVYYTRILRVLIFEKYEGPEVPDAPLSIRWVLGILAGLCVVLGLFPQLCLSFVENITHNLAIQGKIVAQALPDLAIRWNPASLILIAGAIVPYIYRSSARKAGEMSAIVAGLATVIMLFTGGDLDTFSYVLAITVPLFAAVNIFYAVGYMDHGHAQWRFYVFFLIMAGGLLGVISSVDIFSMFFFWEIMSSWSLYFVIVHEETPQALREGFKYFFFNILGACFIFLAVVLLSQWSDGVSFVAISKTLPSLETWQISLAFGALTIGFLMKAAQLPFRIDVQMHPSTAPTPVSGYISAVLLKSALFGLAKIFLALGGASAAASYIVHIDYSFWMDLAVWVGGITIVMAAAFAVFQHDLKLVFIYSTVSQLGYMIAGIGLGTSLGVAGGILHLFNHMIFKDLLFLVAGAVIAQTGKTSMQSMGGLGTRMPATMACFAIGAFCVVGLPPSNGFTSKWIIYHALMEQGYVLVAILSLMGSLITLAYITKVLHSVYLGQPTLGMEKVVEAPKTMLTPMLLLVAGCLLTSLFPGLLLAPINTMLAEFALPQLDIAPWGIASGKGAWNATATAVLFGTAFFGGRYILTKLTSTQRLSPVHTCGVDSKDLNLRATSKNFYSAPGQLFDSVRNWRKK